MKGSPPVHDGGTLYVQLCQSVGRNANEVESVTPTIDSRSGGATHPIDGPRRDSVARSSASMTYIHDCSYTMNDTAAAGGDGGYRDRHSSEIRFCLHDDAVTVMDGDHGSDSIID